MKAAAKGASGQSGQGHGKGRPADNHDADVILAKLYITHHKSLEGYLRRFVNEHDAQDIVHEVMLEILRKHPAWISSRNARAVLFVAVRNRALNFLRKSTRCDYLDPAAFTSVAAKPWRDGEVCERERFDARDISSKVNFHRVLGLRLAGLSLQQIAEREGISLATVKRRIQGIYNKMRRSKDS